MNVEETHDDIEVAFNLIWENKTFTVYNGAILPQAGFRTKIKMANDGKIYWAELTLVSIIVLSFDLFWLLFVKFFLSVF